AIALLGSGRVRVTTPEGTDISFEVGNRPFCSQIGDASRARMESARTRVDRDIELPAGVLRVAPIEVSANGSVVLQVWRPLASQGRNLMLHFIKATSPFRASMRTKSIRSSAQQAGMHGCFGNSRSV